VPNIFAISPRFQVVSGTKCYLLWGLSRCAYGLQINEYHGRNIVAS